MFTIWFPHWSEPHSSQFLPGPNLKDPTSLGEAQSLSSVEKRLEREMYIWLSPQLWQLVGLIIPPSTTARFPRTRCCNALTTLINPKVLVGKSTIPAPEAWVTIYHCGHFLSPPSPWRESAVWPLPFFTTLLEPQMASSLLSQKCDSKGLEMQNSKILC